VDSQQLSVLVIDDDDVIRLAFTDYLEDMGYRVFGAENGRAGVNLFDTQQVDLVMVDLRMPEMDGLEVLEYITQRAPDLPLIVISGTGGRLLCWGMNMLIAARISLNRQSERVPRGLLRNVPVA